MESRIERPLFSQEVISSCQTNFELFFAFSHNVLDGKETVVEHLPMPLPLYSPIHHRLTVVKKNIGILWWTFSCNLCFCMASTKKPQIITRDKVGKTIHTRIGKVMGITH